MIFTSHGVLATSKDIESLIEWARRQARKEQRRYMVRALRLHGQVVRNGTYEAIPASLRYWMAS